MQNLGKAWVLTLLAASLVGCGEDDATIAADNGINGGNNNTDNQEAYYQVRITVLDVNTQSPLSGVVVDINGKMATTNAQGEANFELEDGNYTATLTMSGYQTAQHSFDVSGANLTTSVELTQTAETPELPEVGFIFDSSNEGSFAIEYWGDDWGSGSGISTANDDPDYGEVLVVTSGTNWGKGAAIAWGNDAENSIDASVYTHLSFKIKPEGFVNIEVVVQGSDITESKTMYATDSGEALDNGWYQFEVPFSSTAELVWLGLVLPSDVDGMAKLTDIALITKQVEYSQPSVSAPVPSVSDEDAFALFSDTLTEDKFISVWNANWWNAPLYTSANIDGDNYARYEIIGAGTEGGVAGIEYGIEYGSIDVSQHDNWHIDLYVESGVRQVLLQLVSTDGSSSYMIDSPQTDQWLSLDIPFASMTLNGDVALNSAQMQMIGLQLWGDEGKAVFVDNLYFSGSAIIHQLQVLVTDDLGTPIQNAQVSVGVDGEHDAANKVTTDATGFANLSLSQGKQKVKVSADGFAVAQQIIQVEEGAQPVFALQRLATGPTEAAPVPNVSSDDVISLYSDDLTSNHWITNWSDPWWNPPTHSEITIDGNLTAKFDITPDGEEGGVTGIQYGIETPVDASDKTGLRFDFYATSGVTKVVFQLLSGSQPLFYTIENVETGTWISVELGFDALEAGPDYDRANMQQLGMQLFGTSSDSVYLDNIYFY